MNKLTGMGAGLLFSVLLSGCGGGGGGGSGGGIGVALQPLEIDATNAMQVTAAVMEASALVVDVGEPGGPITGVAVEGDTARVDLARVVRARLDLFSALHQQAAAGQVTAVVIPPTKESCLVSGNVTISGEIADPTLTTLTPGDTLSGVFKNCNDGDGLALNGSMDIVVVSFIGTIDLDPNSVDLFVPPYDFTFDVTLTNLSITETVSGSSFTANGVLTLSEATSDGVFFSSELSGNSLTVRTSATSDTLEDFLVLADLHQGTGAYTTDSGGDDGSGDTVCCATLASTALGGTVDYDTTLPFAGVGDDFPGIGEMDITGATTVGGTLPSKVTVQALDSQCVRLLVDPDGLGVTDTILTTWVSLPTGIQDSSSCNP